MNTYPLLLSPAVQRYLWGGKRLITDFDYDIPFDTAAEAWVLSCHKDGPSRVMNGDMRGKTLPEVLALWGDTATGKHYDRFPIMIKLIDARDSLSIQVHPQDAYALAHEGELGKTEMWYVVDCEPGAQLIYGFNRRIDKSEFQRRIEDNTLTEVCHYVPVKKGDVFFIEAGTLHAIGAGILIAEVQQNSNTTYRVSDFGRLGADGKPRPLHIQQALDVTRTEPPRLPFGPIGQTDPVEGGTERLLATCPLFTVSHCAVNGTMRFGKTDTFSSLLFLKGTARVTYGDEALMVKKGDSLFLPAGITVTVASEGAEILYSFV